MTESFDHSTRDFLQAFTSTGMNEQVMSPSDSTNDINTAQAQLDTSHERTASDPAVVDPPQAHARRADRDALQKVVKILRGMDDRIKKIELSQARIDEGKRMSEAVDRGIFTSMLGKDFAGKLHRDALDWSDLRSHQAPRSGIDRQRAPQRAQQPPAQIPTYQPLHVPQPQAPPAAPMPSSALT